MRQQPQYENEDELDWKGTLLDRNPRRRPQSSYQPEPKSRLFAIGIGFGVLAIVVTLWIMLSGHNSNGDMPLIKADTTPYKSKPDQPGGAQIPFQDKLVFNRLDPNGQPVQAEKLLPGSEEPMAAPTPAPVAPVAVTAPPAAVTAPPMAEAPAPAAAPVTPVATTAAPAPVVEALAVEAAAPVPTPMPTPVAKAEAPKVEAPTPTTTPVAKAPVATTTTSTPAGSVRVQLASIPNADNAQKALSTMSRQYAGALNGTGLAIVKADLPGKGTYYRIQSAPVDRSTADRICTSVKAQGGACITAK